jgi:hypothetical protein
MPLALPSHISGQRAAPGTPYTSLTFQLKLYDVITRAMSALTENGFSLESEHQERAMCIILKIFEDQLADLEIGATKTANLSSEHYPYFDQVPLTLTPSERD